MTLSTPRFSGKNDERTIYNIVYQDGKDGPYLVKRCAISGLTRDKEYNLTRGVPGSKIIYLSANPNGEAEVIKVHHKPKARIKKLILEFDFGQLAIKGKTSRILRQEFHWLTTKLPTLWTNSYFCSTVGGAPLEIVKQYIESQKTSQRK